MNPDTDYNDIADALLQASGYNIYGVDKQIHCAFSNLCTKYYENHKCDTQNCKILKDIKYGTLDKNLHKNLLKKLNIDNINEESGLSVQCPRAVQSHTHINKFCTNTKCHFFSKKMSFHCILLHCRTFFPDEERPQRVIEIATGLSSRVLDRLNKLSIYLIRIYLILFKYGLENLKLDYTLTFQTKYVYELLQCHKNYDIPSIECCSNCGAVLEDKKVIKKKIKNSKEFYLQHQNNCNCSNPDVLQIRKDLEKKWKNNISPDFKEKANYYNLSYKKLYKTYKEDIFCRDFVRYLISKINVNGVYLKDVPIGFILKSYVLLFNEFDASNLGLSYKHGSLLLKNFTRIKGDN